MKKKFFWILSAFFALAALGFFATSGGVAAGLIALLITVLFLPISSLQNKLSHYIKGKWKAVLPVVLIVCFFIAVPQEDSGEVDRAFPSDGAEGAVVQPSETDVEETTLELIEIVTLDNSTESIPTAEEPTFTDDDTAMTENKIIATEVTDTTTQATTKYTEATKETYTTVDTETYTTEAATATTAHNTEPTYIQATTVATERTTTSSENSGRDYVINTNTGKFHYPSCSSVKDISPENRWDYSGTREDIIGMGYVPCKRCDP